MLLTTLPVNAAVLMTSVNIMATISSPARLIVGLTNAIVVEPPLTFVGSVTFKLGRPL